MRALRDEVRYLFSGQGMPYEKVAIMVAVVITLFMGLLLSSNVARDAKIAVIDMDNSRYSHELIEKLDASTYMKVSAALNTPTDPQTLCYQDENAAVIYLPQGLEKDRYAGVATQIGAFYDNTNTALTAEVKAALNEIVAIDNQTLAGADMTGRSINGSLTLSTRNLFNPAGSNSNGEVLGFLFFFSSMFFTFATIGMVPRLRLNGKLAKTLEEGNPFKLMVRIVPYAVSLITALFIGLAILRLVWDLVFTGHVITFFIVEILYIFVLGMECQLMGWTAANPGIASSRMILFIPGGFILGGPTAPITGMWPWVVDFSHIFPLTWQFHFVRDIVGRGAGFLDIAHLLGGFLIYIAIIMVIYFVTFFKARQAMLDKQAKKVQHQAELEG